MITERILQAYSTNNHPTWQNFTAEMLININNINNFSESFTKQKQQLKQSLENIIQYFQFDDRNRLLEFIKDIDNYNSFKELQYDYGTLIEQLLETIKAKRNSKIIDLAEDALLETAFNKLKSASGYYDIEYFYENLVYCTSNYINQVKDECNQKFLIELDSFTTVLLDDEFNFDKLKSFLLKISKYSIDIQIINLNLLLKNAQIGLKEKARELYDIIKLHKQNLEKIKIDFPENRPELLAILATIPSSNNLLFKPPSASNSDLESTQNQRTLSHQNDREDESHQNEREVKKEPEPVNPLNNFKNKPIASSNVRHKQNRLSNKDSIKNAAWISFKILAVTTLLVIAIVAAVIAILSLLALIAATGPAMIALTALAAATTTTLAMNLLIITCVASVATTLISGISALGITTYSLFAGKNVKNASADTQTPTSKPV